MLKDCSEGDPCNLLPVYNNKCYGAFTTQRSANVFRATALNQVKRLSYRIKFA